jgi:hypothetical protein
MTDTQEQVRLIPDGAVYTADQNEPIIPHGRVLVIGDRIIAVGTIVDEVCLRPSGRHEDHRRSQSPAKYGLAGESTLTETHSSPSCVALGSRSSCRPMSANFLPRGWPLSAQLTAAGDSSPSAVRRRWIL